MVSVEYDLRFIREGLPLLEKYLLTDDLYWPAPALAPAGEPVYQSMTLGSLLLARKRLERRDLTPTQQAELIKLDFSWDVLSTRWQSAWQKKVEQELRARINQWGNFIAEYQEHPDAQADRLVTEARSRTMIELLMVGLPPNKHAQNLQEALTNLDATLRARWQSGAFNWPEEFSKSFPVAPFWYLYGVLESAES